LPRRPGTSPIELDPTGNPAGHAQWGGVMPSGTVKWFNPTRGFGFIQPDDGSKDVFVHISALERSDLDGLREGQKVQFDLERGQNGKIAAANLKAG
jgi:CspA family cold shock protein